MGRNWTRQTVKSDTPVVTTCEHDLLGRVAAITYPLDSGSRVIRYFYNASGQTQVVWNETDSAMIAEYAYVGSRVLQVLYGNGAYSEYTYEDAVACCGSSGRVRTFQVKDDTDTLVYGSEFRYNKNSQVVTSRRLDQESYPGISPGNVYVYDSANRLVDAYVHVNDAALDRAEVEVEAAYLGSVGGTPVTAPASGTYLERRTYDRDRGGSLNDVTVTGGPDAEVIDYEMKEEDGYRDRNFYSAIDTAYKDAEVRTRDAANRLVQVEDRFGFRRDYACRVTETDLDGGNWDDPGDDNPDFATAGRDSWAGSTYGVGGKLVESQQNLDTEESNRTYRYYYAPDGRLLFTDSTNGSATAYPQHNVYGPGGLLLQDNPNETGGNYQALYPIRDARTGSTAVTLDDDADIWYRNEHTQTLTGTVGMSSYDGPTGLTAVIASGVEDWSGFDLHDCEVHASTDGSGTGYPVVRYTHLEYGTLHLAGDLTGIFYNSIPLSLPTKVATLSGVLRLDYTDGNGGGADTTVTLTYGIVNPATIVNGAGFKVSFDNGATRVAVTGYNSSTRELTFTSTTVPTTGKLTLYKPLPEHGSTWMGTVSNVNGNTVSVNDATARKFAGFNVDEEYIYIDRLCRVTGFNGTLFSFEGTAPEEGTVVFQQSQTQPNNENEEPQTLELSDEGSGLWSISPEDVSVDRSYDAEPDYSIDDLGNWDHEPRDSNKGCCVAEWGFPGYEDSRGITQGDFGIQMQAKWGRTSDGTMYNHYSVKALHTANARFVNNHECDCRCCQFRQEVKGWYRASIGTNEYHFDNGRMTMTTSWGEHESIAGLAHANEDGERGYIEIPTEWEEDWSVHEEDGQYSNRHYGHGPGSGCEYSDDGCIYRMHDESMSAYNWTLNDPGKLRINSERWFRGSVIDICNDGEVKISQQYMYSYDVTFENATNRPHRGVAPRVTVTSAAGTTYQRLGDLYSE